MAEWLSSDQVTLGYPRAGTSVKLWMFRGYVPHKTMVFRGS